jgi:hypothetical protein
MFSFFYSAAKPFDGRMEIATPAAPAAPSPFSSDRRELGRISVLIISQYLLCIGPFFAG